MNLEALKRVLNPINRRLKIMFTRGLVKLVDPSAAAQMLQVSLFKHPPLDDIEHIEPYGYTAHPHADAECIALSFGGRRSHTIVITVADRRYRLTSLAQGEVAIYDDLAQKVHLKRDGIYITSSQQLVVDTPMALFAGDVGIDGGLYAREGISTDGPIDAAEDITSDGDVVAGNISLKLHPHAGSPSAPTGPVSPTGQPLP